MHDCYFYAHHSHTNNLHVLSNLFYNTTPNNINLGYSTMHTIRTMQATDIESVFKIEKLVQSHPWTLSQFKDAQQSYACHVMEHQQRIIGFCIFQTVLDEASLLLMAIHPNFQGQGLGFKLLDFALNALDNQPVQIFLEVRESNTPAIKLYEKLGFHQIDIRKNYYPHHEKRHENAIIMVKSQVECFQDLFKS